MAGEEHRKDARHSIVDRLEEAVGLAHAIELTVAGSQIVRISNPRPATLFGAGKVDEIRTLIDELDTGLIIVDHALTPIQQRNLERAWNAKVLDRTGLILEIFGRRARTREGRLQVELAHLMFQRSRLVRSWTHLERQRGGFGFLGGPGETQIETDRRLLRDRIEKLRSELDKVKRTRALHRAGRTKVPYPVVAIVGYTNAGKSTLFNRLTGASVLSEDQVFATLDPTMRELQLVSGRRVILSDTVGFISDLPTMLVAAFRATLEEVVAADVILHVRDISHAETEAQREDVEKVLTELLGEAGEQTATTIEVWNKIDLVTPEHRADIEAACRKAAIRGRAPQLTSAVTGEGLGDLCGRIDDLIGRGDLTVQIDLPPDAGKLRHWLHENATVLSATPADSDTGTTHLEIRISNIKHGQLLHHLEQLGLSASH
ncbi:MAG: GTPase HflX [Alphaproteobacteria bacterium]|nr:GTPase HflX [Alphaproteobacteria bacterium]